ncbi:hypothetical protein EVAR_100423_1 [Eumeta japonica]|uniref:Uncharacterized protein n=1 Tax=Eumeta variegata TaxID=151549 RepID=A0A4C2A6Y7_EUMVA|nr:hypothetical protein EVAR_100423_1 [Eumeta japonica]
MGCMSKTIVLLDKLYPLQQVNAAWATAGHDSPRKQRAALYKSPVGRPAAFRSRAATITDNSLSTRAAGVHREHTGVRIRPPNRRRF